MGMTYLPRSGDQSDQCALPAPIGEHTAVPPIASMASTRCAITAARSALLNLAQAYSYIVSTEVSTRLADENATAMAESLAESMEFEPGVLTSIHHPSTPKGVKGSGQGDLFLNDSQRVDFSEFLARQHDSAHFWPGNIGAQRDLLGC